MDQANESLNPPEPLHNSRQDDQVNVRPANGKGRGTARAFVVLALVIVIAVILIMPSTQDFLKNSFISPFQASYPEYADISYTRTMTVDPNGGKINDFTVRAVMPQDISSGGVALQDVTSSNRYPNTTPDPNNGTMIWKGGPLIGQQTYTITLSYSIRETTKVWNIARADSGTIDQIDNSLKLKYLGDEWKILATDPQITALSKQVNGDNTNVYSILRASYDWVTSNIAYSTSSGDPKDSVQTLTDRTGDCDDTSNLYLGMIRAAGVPGWLQLGALYDKVNDRMEGHAWVQTYIPDKNGGGSYVTIDLVNKNFLVWKPTLICDYTDNGNASDLKSYYYTFYSVYDPTTYAFGDGPSFTDSYSVVSYSESSNRISLSSIEPASIAAPPAMRFTET